MTIEEMLRIKEKKWKAEGKADTMEELTPWKSSLQKCRGYLL